MIQGFLLGLANGTVCLASCCPVLVPFLLGEGQGIGRNYRTLTLFLSGRLAGYLVFSLPAWLTHQALAASGGVKNIVTGAVYLILAVAMLFYGFRRRPAACAVAAAKPLPSRFRRLNPWLFPAILGFLTGINLCPPFLLAFAGAALGGTLLQTAWFFFMFFLGTSLYFLPAPLLGGLSRYPNLKTVGQLAAGVIALYYFYEGILLFGNSM
jgi:sulfite exporter TauE/SafE